MGEAFMKKYLKDEKYEVTSAGIGALDGNQPTRHGVLVMKKFALDITGHRAKYLTKQIIEESDLILVMEQAQVEYIVGFNPQAKDKIFLLTNFANGESVDIADPMGQGAAFYLKTAMLLDKYTKLAAERIMQNG
jgi:protein-tyrosine-phosphatase